MGHIRLEYGGSGGKKKNKHSRKRENPRTKKEIKLACSNLGMVVSMTLRLILCFSASYMITGISHANITAVGQSVQRVDGTDTIQPVSIISTFSVSNPGHVRSQQLGVYTVTPGTGTFNVAFNSSDLALQGSRFSAELGVKSKVATSEEAVILIRNPTGSGKNLFFDRGIYTSIEIGINFIFRLRHSPTITSTGTVVAVNNLLISSPIQSGMQIFSFPTATVTGSLFRLFQVKDSPYIDEVDGRIVISPGKDILITIERGSNGKEYAAGITWWEAPQ
jgi:hypothetical protein